MTNGENPTQEQDKEKMVRFDNLDDFFNYKFGPNYRTEYKNEYLKINEFEKQVNTNKGNYFFMWLKNGISGTGEYIVGVLHGEICYSVHGERGEPFENMGISPGFLQHFYHKEIIVRTEKRAFTKGGELDLLFFEKLREDPALSIDDVLKKQINYFFGDNALRVMAKTFSTNVNKLKPYLDCNIMESD